MKRVAFGLAAVLVAAGLGLTVPPPTPAFAQPSSSSPANGATIPATSEVFSWTDNHAEGSLWNYYLEISTSPTTDYAYFGYFMGGIVFSSGDLAAASLNLNSIGRALPGGTYYWHVLGKYGYCGANGTSWTAVRSFVVKDPVAVAPRLSVSPATMSFTVQAGTSGVQVALAQDFTVANTGGGSLYFNFGPHVASSWLLDTGCTDVGGVCTAQATVDPTGLGVGTYPMALDVWDSGSSPAALNSPQSITVTLHVVAAPVVPDITAPTKPTLVAPAYSTTLSSSSAVVLKWTASTDPAPASGLAGYLIRWRMVPSTTWLGWGGVRTGVSASFTAVPGSTYQFDIRSGDKAGNVSLGSTVVTTRVPWDQVSASYVGVWAAVAQVGSYRGSIKRTIKLNASAAITKVGRYYGILVTKGPGRGKVGVYVDGHLISTVDTYATTVKLRQYIAIKTFATAGTHTIKIVNRATAGRPKIELDGLLANR